MPENETIEETITEVVETTEENIEIPSESDILDDVPGTEEDATEDSENIENTENEYIEESSEDVTEESTEEITQDSVSENDIEELPEDMTEELTEELMEEIYNTYFGHRVYYNSAGYPYYFDENGDRVYISDTENIVHAGVNTEESTEESTEDVEIITEIPFLEKPFTDYSVSEGLLLLIFILLLIAFVRSFFE